jgi:hypothetical protein
MENLAILFLVRVSALAIYTILLISLYRLDLMRH